MNESLDLNAALERHRSSGGWLELARAITAVENQPTRSVNLPDGALPVHCIGVTGPPGVGKSTLVGRLIQAFTQTTRRVGVIAVDPSSSITGGAVLGDRIRMERYLAEGSTFVRSIASRGSQGALAVAARRVMRLMEASGSFDVLILETVGAGQADVAISVLADTVLLVTIPGLGDAVQSLKAGYLEIADVVVVNMADKPGAPEAVRHMRASIRNPVDVYQTVATLGTGVDDVRSALDRRWDVLSHDDLAAHRHEGDIAESTLLAEQLVRAAASDLAPTFKSIDVAVGLILGEALRRWRR